MKKLEDHLIKKVVLETIGNLSLRDKNMKKVIMAFVYTLLIFSSLSYIISITVYIVVPVISTFLVTFLLPEKKSWAVFPVIIATFGSVIFSGGPPRPGGLETPSLVLQDILAGRRAEMLAFTPPFLMGILGGILGWGIASIVRPSPT